RRLDDRRDRRIDCWCTRCRCISARAAVRGCDICAAAAWRRAHHHALCDRWRLDRRHGPGRRDLRAQLPARAGMRRAAALTLAAAMCAALLALRAPAPAAATTNACPSPSPSATATDARTCAQSELDQLKQRLGGDL